MAFRGEKTHKKEEEQKLQKHKSAIYEPHDDTDTNK